MNKLSVARVNSSEVKPVACESGRKTFDPDATITVCADCFEPIQRVGEDYLNFCESCQQVEGNTVEISESDYEEMNA